MILQKQDIFNRLGIKEGEDADKIFNLIMGFFVYMKAGDELSTSLIDFRKVDNELMWIESKIDVDEMVDSLESLKIIKIPG